jgi:phosphatidate cytidylyltransferase
MKPRILTALLLIPPVIYLVGWSPPWLLSAAVITAVELCLYEFFQLCQLAEFKALRLLAHLAGAALCLLRALAGARADTFALVLLLLFLVAALTLALPLARDLKAYLGAVAETLFGVAYIALTLSCLLPLRFSSLGASALGLEGAAGASCGRNLLFLLLLVVWADDTFAYFVGRSLGRRRPFPTISPKKTVEGSLAGFAGSLLVAWAFVHWCWQTADLKTVMLIAGLVALFAQIGDLAESAMKRGANVKDSGAVLPGHGGLLDRLDSLLFGAPVMWLTLVVLDFWR